VGKTTKRFKDYIEEDYGFRKKKLKKESRHNTKEHLRDLIEHEDWEELEDETLEYEHSNHIR